MSLRRLFPFYLNFFKSTLVIMIQQVERMISQRSEQSGVIIADHQYRNVLKIANRILLLKDGYIKELNDAESLKSNGYLL